MGKKVVESWSVEWKLRREGSEARWEPMAEKK